MSIRFPDALFFNPGLSVTKPLYVSFFSSSHLQLPVEIVPIEDEGFHLVIRAAINGVDARLLVDTGASRTVFDRDRYRQFVSEISFIPDEKLSAGLGTNTMQDDAGGASGTPARSARGFGNRRGTPGYVTRQ
jgi:hypothetical protein